MKSSPYETAAWLLADETTEQNTLMRGDAQQSGNKKEKRIFAFLFEKNCYKILN